MIIQHRLPGCDTIAAHEVRAAVFQNEQGISAKDDYDGLDATAEQFLALISGKPVGTARYRLLGDGVAKVERVAVLSEQRGNKVGHAIMEAIEYTAWRQHLGVLVLDAQQEVEHFYLRMGYQRDGDVFEEVGIPHVKMSLDVRHPSEAELHYGPFSKPYDYVDVYPGQTTSQTPRSSGIQF